MKKFFAMLMAVAIMTFAEQVEAISCEDSTFAFNTINQQLHGWKCTPLKIWYGGDELNNAENIKYMNEFAKGNGFEPEFTACMVFYSDFHTPRAEENQTTFNHDSDYKNWSWYFGLYKDGTWKLLTFGY